MIKELNFNQLFLYFLGKGGQDLPNLHWHWVLGAPNCLVAHQHIFWFCFLHIIRHLSLSLLLQTLGLLIGGPFWGDFPFGCSSSISISISSCMDLYPWMANMKINASAKKYLFIWFLICYFSLSNFALSSQRKFTVLLAFRHWNSQKSFYNIYQISWEIFWEDFLFL